MPNAEINLKEASGNVEASIKYQLALQGVSQKSLADKLKVFPSQVSRAIKGSNDPKSIDIRTKIYRELGMTK